MPKNAAKKYVRPPERRDYLSAEPAWHRYKRHGNLLLVKEFILKQKQVDDGDGDVGVGEVEDRAEEIVVAVDQKPQEARHAVPLEQREIEHVDDLAHHEAGVVAPECGDGVRRRCREQQSVECAVEDVAHGAGEDQGQSDDNASGRILAVVYQAADEPCYASGQRDAEDA